MNRDATTVLVGPGTYFADELVERFSRLTSHFVLVARREGPLLELAHRHHDQAVCIPVVQDVRSASLPDALLSALTDLPPVRFVIYNVKVSPRGPALEIGQDQFNAALESNVTGALTLLQLLASPLFPRTSPCVFINTGGGFKDSPDQTRLALSVSKAGIHNLTLALTQSLNRRGILLKTLVVDGVVRSEGPIKPALVVDQMERLALDPTRRVGRVDSSQQATADQISLF